MTAQAGDGEEAEELSPAVRRRALRLPQVERGRAVGRVDAKANQKILCKQHEYGSTAFIIESGTIDIVVGDKVVGGRDKSDYILGEMACLTHQARIRRR